SCLVPFTQCAGAEIRTVEGLARESDPHPVQRCFVECGGAQCGICTPGMLMSAAALLDREAEPSPERVREALSGNLCRCTGYMKIVDSVVHAARALRERESAREAPVEVSP